MFSSIVVPVIRNPVFIMASLIFAIIYGFMPSFLSSLFDISGFNLGFILLRESFFLVTAAFFMAGTGYLLKNIVSEGTAGCFDFIEGVRLFFSKVLLINLLITMLRIFGGPIALIFRPNMLMGAHLPLMSFGLYIILILVFIVSPFFVLWYPAIFIEKTGIAEIISKAIITGKKAYLKLLLSVLIPLLPSFFYLGFTSGYVGSIFSAGYYFLFGTTFILSLFAMPFMFKIYNDER